MRRLFAVFLLAATTISAAPLVTSVSPIQGSESGGTKVTIRGSGFNNSARVLFDGVIAPNVGFASASELTALTPPHLPGTVAVTVFQNDGEATLSSAFTYVKDVYSLSPVSGPAAGGTVVTIKGRFGSTPFIAVIFGKTTVPTWRISADTVLAIAPPGDPGSSVEIDIVDDDVVIQTNLHYSYQANPVDFQERVLLPILSPPSNGAFGSRFVTELRGFNRFASQTATLYGLSRSCKGVCPPVVPDPTRDSVEIPPRAALSPSDIVYNGTPGRFIYVPTNRIDHLWLNLRVRDESRSLENLGTELPPVRDRDLFRHEPIVFDDVPTDAPFRTTLRIYAESAVKIRLEIAPDSDFVIVREIDLPAPVSRFEPAYAQIGDLPVDLGPVRITITTPEPGQPGFYTPIWAFISVTNNDTQHITTIRP